MKYKQVSFLGIDEEITFFEGVIIPFLFSVVIGFSGDMINEGIMFKKDIITVLISYGLYIISISLFIILFYNFIIWIRYTLIKLTKGIKNKKSKNE